MRIRGAIARDKSRSFVIEELELDEPRYNVVSVRLVDASDPTICDRVGIGPESGVNVEITLSVEALN